MSAVGIHLHCYRNSDIEVPFTLLRFRFAYFDNANLTKNILKKRRTRLEEEFPALTENIQFSPILSGEPHQVLAKVKKIRI
jgi:ATP-dependent DNA ligase